jgi:hypothetical protein
MVKEYQEMVVNGWLVTFRFRDYNQIKVAGIIREFGFPEEIDLPNTFDDCCGNEFLSLLNILNHTDSFESVESQLNGEDV